MIKKRVIPVLLLNHGRMVKGKQFSHFRDTGEPTTAVRIYSAQDADELVFLNIQNTDRSGWQALIQILYTASAECFMPLSAGGGVRSLEDISELLHAGADKVVITSASVINPEIITEGARKFGSQCIVAGIDYRLSNSGYRVWINSGTKETSLDPISHARHLEQLGAGELFLNSIDNDGMMTGYNLALVQDIVKSVKIPVITCGGAGNFLHLAQAFQVANVSGVACASLFHFGDNNPIRARSYLRNLNIPMRVLK